MFASKVFDRGTAALVAAVAFALVVPGCSREPVPRQEMFVGKWKSSRLATPLHLHQNGEWEIKTDEDRVLQYGVWQLEGKRFVWSIRIDGRVQRDENAVLAVSQRRFELREQDGSTTKFDRLD
jgi:hypothetical protein